LAWREAYVAWKKAIINPDLKDDVVKLMELHSAAFGNAPFDKDRDKDKLIPTIYYTSRTHSQLSQCVKEIKNTIYRFAK
jgi:hypothetical protein